MPMRARNRGICIQMRIVTIRAENIGYFLGVTDVGELHWRGSHSNNLLSRNSPSSSTNQLPQRSTLNRQNALSEELSENSQEGKKAKLQISLLLPNLGWERFSAVFNTWESSYVFSPHIDKFTQACEDQKLRSLVFMKESCAHSNTLRTWGKSISDAEKQDII